MADDGLTFRDFAGALMAQDASRASEVLQALMGVDADAGAAATAFFQEQMQTQGQAFMMKAMSMRKLVDERDEAGMKSVIEACFGMDGDAATAAAATVMKRYE